MEPSSAGQGKWRRQSERRTPNCRSDKTTIQRNDVPRGTMNETSSLWTLVSIALPRSVRKVRLFRLFLLIPCWESQRLIPKRSAGPRATKIGVVSLKALDRHRPNREKSAVLALNYPPPAPTLVTRRSRQHKFPHKSRRHRALLFMGSLPGLAGRRGRKRSQPRDCLVRSSHDRLSPSTGSFAGIQLIAFSHFATYRCTWRQRFDQHRAGR